MFLSFLPLGNFSHIFTRVKQVKYLPTNRKERQHPPNENPIQHMDPKYHRKKRMDQVPLAVEFEPKFVYGYQTARVRRLFR